MAIERSSPARPASRPPQPRAISTLGGLLKHNNIEVRGPISIGKLGPIAIAPQNLLAVEALMSKAKYFVIGSGVSVNQLRDIMNRPGLTGIESRGGRIIALGRITAIMPPLERYLQEAEVELKCRHFGKAAEALLWASALAEEKPDRDSVRAIISGKMASHLSALAEHLVVARQPEAVMDLFIGHGDHFINQSLLTHLNKLSTHERMLDTLKGDDLKKYLRKAKLIPTVIEALAHGYALETEAEVCSRLLEAFPKNIEYLKHYIETSIAVKDFEDAGHLLKQAKDLGIMDRAVLELSDKLRAALIEDQLEGQPKVTAQLEQLFNKLKSGGLTPEEFGAVKAIGIGMEYFIYRGLKLLSEKRFLAYQTICRLSELEDNGMEQKISELKNGIFGRMINDAINGGRLINEEESLLKNRELIMKYMVFNPQRMEIFLGQIEDVLLRGQKNGRQVVNGEVLRLIYKYARIEKDSRASEEDISLEFADGFKSKIESEDDMLGLGWQLLGYGQEQDVLELSRTYSAKYPGLAGYETELLALTELGRFEEAAARFRLLRPMLKSEPAARIEQMIILGQPYYKYEADSILAKLIAAKREEAGFEGKKYSLRDYDKDAANQLLSLAMGYERSRPYVFARLTEVLRREAETVEGGRLSMAFLSAVMLELGKPNPELAPLADQFNQMLDSVNESIQALLTGQTRIVRNVLAKYLSFYLRALSKTTHFSQAGQVMELMVQEERKQRKLDLRVAKCLLGAAINYGNAGLEEKAIALQLELADLYALATDKERKELLAQSGSRDDLLAQNYALLANLVPEPARIAEYVALAEQHRPSSPATLSNLGAAYLFLKEHAKAEVYLRKVLSLNPEMHMSIHDLSAVLIETGRSAEALDLIKAFIAKNAEVAPSLGWLSNILFRLADEGGLAEALEIMEKHFQSFSREQMRELYLGLPYYIKRRFASGYSSQLGL